MGHCSLTGRRRPRALTQASLYVFIHSRLVVFHVHDKLSLIKYRTGRQQSLHSINDFSFVFAHFSTFKQVPGQRETTQQEERMRRFRPRFSKWFECTRCIKKLQQHLNQREHISTRFIRSCLRYYIMFYTWNSFVTSGTILFSIVTSNFFLAAIKYMSLF